MKESNADKLKGTRADEIMGRLSGLFGMIRTLRRETETLADIVTGDRPKDAEDVEKQDGKPTCFLAALEHFLNLIEANGKAAARNVEFVKDQVSVSDLTEPQA